MARRRSAPPIASIMPCASSRVVGGAEQPAVAPPASATTSAHRCRPVSRRSPIRFATLTAAKLAAAPPNRRSSERVFDLTLTFDNGPTPATPVVLDLLARHGIRSTFFLTGKQLAIPGMRVHAERAVREGHWIGNHTYSHRLSL